MCPSASRPRVAQPPHPPGSTPWSAGSASSPPQVCFWCAAPPWRPPLASPSAVTPSSLPPHGDPPWRPPHSGLSASMALQNHLSVPPPQAHGSPLQARGTPLRGMGKETGPGWRACGGTEGRGHPCALFRWGVAGRRRGLPQGRGSCPGKGRTASERTWRAAGRPGRHRLWSLPGGCHSGSVALGSSWARVTHGSVGCHLQGLWWGRGLRQWKGLLRWMGLQQ